jgi:hypothetical protein
VLRIKDYKIGDDSKRRISTEKSEKGP